jgi:predicted nucleic acid-binding protein
MGKEEISVLADTDVLIALSDNKKQQNQLVSSTFQHFLNVGTIISVSIVTEMEMIQGSKNNVEKNRIIKFITPFNTLNLTPTIANLSRQLIVNYSASHGLAIADALVAATALNYSIPLFTFNKKDFRFITGLRLYEP